MGIRYTANFGFAKMLRKLVVVVACVSVLYFGVACTKKTFIDPEPIPGLTLLWYMYGLTYGTDGQEYIEKYVNGQVQIVPSGSFPSESNVVRRLANAAQPTISPTGQTVGLTKVTPGSGTVTQTVYAPDGFTNSILVISVPGLTQTAKIAFPAQVNDVVLSPDQSTLYAAVFPASQGGAGSIAVISTSTNSITRTIPLPAGTYPQWEAISPDGATLYIADNRAEYGGASSNYFLAIDTASGAVKASLTVTPAFNSPLGRPVVAPDGLSIYQADIQGFEVIDATTLQSNYPVSVSINNKSHSVFSPDGSFLFAPGYSSIYVIDAATRRLAETIKLPGGNSSLLGDLAVLDGSTLLATDLTGANGSGAMYQIDAKAGTIVATIQPPAGAPKQSSAMQLVVLP